MPIYGYECTNCKHSFDVLQKISDPKLEDCPACGESSLRKQLSAPKFRLKGQGWYETDFKTGDKRNLAGDAEKAATSKDADKPAEKADKPAEKADKPAEKKDAKKASTDSKAKTA